MSEVKKSELKTVVGGRLYTGVAKPKPSGVYPSKTPLVTWNWYNEDEGVVQWVFDNQTPKTVSFLLFRNGYFFGNAFWPVYVANPGFNVSWITVTPVQPLDNSGDLEKHGARLAPVKIPGSSTTNKYLIAFVFTLTPESFYSILEGGFSKEMPPSDIALVNVVPGDPQDFCIGYDPEQVEAWDLQTKTLMQGYTPNQMTIETVPFTPLNFEGTDSPWHIASGNVYPSFAPLFNDPVAPGKCINCKDLIQEALVDFDKGEIKEGLEMLGKAIDCYTKRDSP